MFERLKGENDVRKNEIHGLKDILVRENEKIQREQVEKLPQFIYFFPRLP